MEELLEDISFQERENRVGCSGTSPEWFKLRVGWVPSSVGGGKTLEKQETDERWLSYEKKTRIKKISVTL